MSARVPPRRKLRKASDGLREKYPDKVPRALKDEFQEKFIEIANAYEILSNEKRRRRYDQTGLMGDEEEGDGRRRVWRIR